MPLHPDKQAARAALGIPDGSLCLALLPGSRGAEVEMLSADFLHTARLLRQRFPALEIVVPLVNGKRREQFERIKTAWRLIYRCIYWTGARAKRRSPATPRCWPPAPPRWSACWPNARWWWVIV